MARQLIIHDNDLVAEEAAKAVKTSIGESARTDIAHNFARAREMLNDPSVTWSLVVVGASAPESCYTRGGSDDCSAARNFIRELKATYRKLPVIALTDTHDPQLAGLLSAYEDSAALIVFDATWGGMLAKRARELQQSIQSEGSVLELEITLEGKNSGVWSLARGGRIGIKERGPLQIEPDRFKELLGKCEELAHQTASVAAWIPPLNTVAGDLKRLLFTGSQQNDTLWLKFVDERAKVGGTQNTRIFFTLSPDMQPMVVEALKDIGAPPTEYWMLKAPIIRQYNCSREPGPLFKDDQSFRGPINCLVIDADPSKGKIDDDDWQGSFDPLINAGDEASAIVNILNEAKEKKCGIGRVERLQLANCKDDRIRAVKDRLDDGPWHLVHFVGHGVMSKQRAAGLVLEAIPGGVLSFEALTPKLLKTQFLFLSSCQSASPAFLTSAIHSLVPAVLGFRWPVLDHGAFHFAESFYAALFKRGELSFKSLEYAFLDARVAAFKVQSDEATWASPILLTQLRKTDLN